MTATERLRAMLDELRKLACDINEEEIRSHSVITLNQGRYSRQFRLDMNHDWLNAWHAELERILQAIAATLGAGQAADEWGEGFRAGCDAANKASEESVEHYKAENAKLRELTRAAWRCIHTGASCSDCRLIAGGCTLQTAMRELGVDE